MLLTIHISITNEFWTTTVSCLGKELRCLSRTFLRLLRRSHIITTICLSLLFKLHFFPYFLVCFVSFGCSRATTSQKTDFSLPRVCSKKSLLTLNWDLSDLWLMHARCSGITRDTVFKQAFIKCYLDMYFPGRDRVQRVVPLSPSINCGQHSLSTLLMTKMHRSISLITI